MLYFTVEKILRRKKEILNIIVKAKKSNSASKDATTPDNTVTQTEAPVASVAPVIQTQAPKESEEEDYSFLLSYDEGVIIKR